MSMLSSARSTNAGPGGPLTVWLKPFRFTAGPRGLLTAGACVLVLEVIFLFDILSPGASLATVALLPIFVATWLLPLRLAGMVLALAILNRLATGATGQVAPLEALTDAISFLALAAIARVAAVYVDATQAAVARADLLARIGRIATSADSLQAILDQILAEMAGEGLRGGLIALINERNEIYPAAAEGDIDQAVMDSRIPIGTGIMGTVAARGRPILVRDIDAPEVPVAPVNRDLGSNRRLRSLVAVPMLAAGKVIGVLEVDSSLPDRFDDEDLALLEQIAFAVSGAVQREGALQLADEAVKKRVEELSLLLDGARSLAASLEPEVVQATVVRTVARVVTAEGGHAALIRIEDGRLTEISDFDGEAVRTRRIDFPLAFAPAELMTAVTTGHAHGSRRTEVDPGLAAVFGPRATAFAWAPVRIGDQTYGVVAASSERDLFEWPALRLLEGVADLAGLAIGNAERLRLEKSRTSELTSHANRMAELEKVKSDFLKVASHELRGPLSVLKGYVSMLSDGSVGPDGAVLTTVLGVITAKLHEVSELVDQMLETARLEDSRLELQLRRVDLREILAEAAERTLALAAPAHRLVVKAGARQAPVLVDRVRVLSIITNLLGNAVKYSPAGGEVTATLGLSQGFANLSVRDSGLGIAATDQAQLFTRFGRIVTSANSHIPGTGLGLYLARELARMHGGDITVRSTEGAGSIFTLTLPIAAELAPDPMPEALESDV